MVRATEVSIFIPSMVGGGAEKVALNLSTGLANQGIEVDLVLTRAVGELMDEISPKVKIIDLEVKDLRSRATWQRVMALARYLKQKKPKFLLAILDDVNISIWAKIIAGVPTKVIISVHNTFSEDFRGYKGRLRTYLIRLTYPWVDGIVAVSQGVAEDLARLSGISLDKIQVIYNPVVTPQLLEMASEPIDHPWFAADQPPVILGIGRLVEQKKFSLLIKAFAEVRKQINVRLMILGEGKQRKELENLVQTLGLNEAISLPGFQDNPYKFMAQAALFVLSSAWEGFGLVIVEALAVGTSVVSTDCPSGPSEILEKGKFGGLAPVGHVNALASAILDKLHNPMNADILRQQAMNFSVDKSIEHYVEFMKSISSPSRLS